MSRVIRSEDVADCQSWCVPEVQQQSAEGSQPMTARQLEEMHEQARREGFEQGLQEGREAGQNEFRQRLRFLEQAIDKLDAPFQELDAAVEQQLAQLAMLVARQLVRRELKTDPSQVIGVVREALSALPLAARDVRLVLHPDDAELVREALAIQGDKQTLRLVEDPLLERGGCRILSETSQIDATVEARLNAVIANVLGGLRSGDCRDRDA